MPTPSSPDTSELLLHTVRALRRSWMSSLEPWGLTPHEVRALRVVVDGLDEARLSDLADRLRIAARSATEVVDSLETKGLVRREPSPRDRRAVIVRATDDGARVASEVAAARAEVGTAFLAPLEEEEQRTLHDLLERLVHPHQSPPPSPAG